MSDGLSFIDIKNLTTDNLEIAVGGRFIAGKRQKTGIPFRVKLLDSAYRIIERYEPYRKGNRLFDFPCNSQTNQKLKKILTACGIDKPVTFHGSRHSFATLALTKGMPIETVSKILGHTNKVTAEKMEREMSAFGEKLEAGLAARAASFTPVVVPMPTAPARSKSVAVN